MPPLFWIYSCPWLEQLSTKMYQSCSFSQVGNMAKQWWTPFAWARPTLQPRHRMTSFCASLVPWCKNSPDQWSLSAEIELSISRVELTCSVAKTRIVFSNTCDIITVGLRKLPNFAQQRLNDCLTKQTLLCETSQNDFDFVHSCLLNRNNWVKTNY